MAGEVASGIAGGAAGKNLGNREAESRLTKEFLHSMFSYDAETGKLFWKERTRGTLSDSSFRHAGKPAESFDVNPKSGYKRTRIKLFGHSYTASRLIWIFHKGPIPHGLEMDHDNRNPSDNRIENLRAVTRSENMKNLKFKNPTISGYKGVFRHKHKWKAECRMNGKRLRAYGFSTAFGAALAYDEMAYKQGGEYALLNFPNKHSMSYGK